MQFKRFEFGAKLSLVFGIVLGSSIAVITAQSPPPSSPVASSGNVPPVTAQALKQRFPEDWDHQLYVYQDRMSLIGVEDRQIPFQIAKGETPIPRDQLRITRRSLPR